MDAIPAIDRPYVALQDDFGRKWNETEFSKLKKKLSSSFNVVSIRKGMKVGSRKKLNMREAAGVIEKCDLFIGGISGNLHAAVAVGTPTIATPNVFNPRWDMPYHYLPSEHATKHTVIEPDTINFCGSFKCVDVGPISVTVSMGDYSSPTCDYGFSKSCVNSIKHEKILEATFQFFKI